MIIMVTIACAFCNLKNRLIKEKEQFTVISMYCKNITFQVICVFISGPSVL